jgi:MFS superfamily sulfate permease-like transporter
MEYLDLALDYLKDHKLVAALIAMLFVILLIRSFWFLVKLLVILALAAVALVLVSSFLGEVTKKKKDLMAPGDSSHLRTLPSCLAQWSPPPSSLDLSVPREGDPPGYSA